MGSDPDCAAERLGLKRMLTQWFHRLHYTPLSQLPLWGRGLMWLLSPLSWGMAVGVRLRASLYRWRVLASASVPVSLWSVGNLTTGGTGKTPIVKALAAQAIAEGQRVAILSRGYGAKRPQAYGRATHSDFGDEAFELQKALPTATVIVGAKRAANALRFLQEASDTSLLLLDDGFQYLPLQAEGRGRNICLVDGEHGFGNGLLLPLGPLREPLSALKRATEVWITKLPSPEDARFDALTHQIRPYLAPDTPIRWVENRLGSPYALIPTTDSPPPSEASWMAFSAIAQPDAFARLLKAAGYSLAAHVIAPDHACFDASHRLALEAHLATLPPETRIATTEKDASKLIALQHLAEWQPLLARCCVFPLVVSLPSSSLVYQNKGLSS